MNKYIIANLKMFQTTDMVSNYLDILSKIKDEKLILCPSNIYIPYYLEKGYTVGIQNVSSKDIGAYTGEISPLQASGIGITYVIIGHSERRLLGETDAIIQQKIVASLKHDLNVILCIGETSEEKHIKKDILSKQIQSALKGIPKEKISKLFFAYEPRWAIGTGIIPETKEIETTIHYIQTICFEFINSPVKIIYGGSVDENNISDLMQIKEIDGFLIGSASVDANRLLKIIEVTSK